MNFFAVIMAGGIGARFWPRSKKQSPKQLLKIVGDSTMIQETVRRIHGLVPKKNILIVTNEVQKPGIIEQLPEIPIENIIVEPFGRNTAACIGLCLNYYSKAITGRCYIHYACRSYHKG